MAVALINLVFLDPSTNGGLSRIAKEISWLLCEIADEQRHFHPVFAVNNQFVGGFSQWLGRSPDVIRVDANGNPRPALRGLNCDLIVSPLFGVEPIDQISELRGRQHIAMMPDALALDMPHFFNSQITAQRRTSYERLKRASHIITLSQFSQQRLAYHLKLPPEQIIPIPLGADIGPTPGHMLPEIDRYHPYLFYPANAWPHKRHDLAFAAFAAILEKRPEMHLVLTGGRFDNFDVSIPALIAKHHLPTERVIDLGFVEDGKIGMLYANAEAMLFTSEYEGFGMPLLEAMQFGCPVICASVAAMPEIGGDAVLYVHTNDPTAWATAFTVELPKQRDVLIERGRARAASFTWMKTRSAYKQLFLNIAPQTFNGTNRNVPMVTLPFALREANTSLEVGNMRLTSSSAYLIPANANTLTASTIDLTTHLGYLNELLEQEKRSVWGKLPFVGIVIRLLIRLRNLSRFWRASSEIAVALVQRQSVLSSAVEQLWAHNNDDTIQK